MDNLFEKAKVEKVIKYFVLKIKLNSVKRVFCTKDQIEKNGIKCKPNCVKYNLYCNKSSKIVWIKFECEKKKDREKWLNNEKQIGQKSNLPLINSYPPYLLESPVSKMNGH